MGWRDRAVKEKAAPKKGGSWRDRAVKMEEDPNAPIVTPDPFPDTDTPEVKAMKAAERKYEAEKPGTLETAALGAYQGATRDWGDELAAKASSLFNGQSYDDNRARIQHKMERARLESPKTYGAGELAGAIGTAPAIASPVGVASLAMAEGTARSLGKAQRIDNDSLIKAPIDGAIDGVTAGTLSKFTPMAFAAMKKMASPIAGKLSAFAGRQAVKALQPTQGMMKQLNDKGLTEDVGNFALENKIVRPFNSAKSMNETAQKVTQGFADQTKPIYAKAKGITMTKDELVAAMRMKQAEMMAEEGGVKVAKKIGKYADEAEQSLVDSYNPDGLRKYRQRVQDGLNFNTKPNAQVGGQEVRKILREKEMGLIEKMDPKLRAENEKLFRNIRLGNEVEKVAERGEARSGVNNLLGLNSGIMGSAAGAATTAVTGDALTGAIVAGAVGVGREITKRYGNQWAATGTKGLERIISGDKFRPLFEEAAKRGGTAIPELHQMLMESDPDYSSQIEAEVRGNRGSKVMHAKDLP